MYFVFTNWDDIYETYGTKNCRNLSDRLAKVLNIHRQPRPRLNIDVYTNRRNLLIQKIEPKEIITDFVMDTRRKGIYNDIRRDIS